MAEERIGRREFLKKMLKVGAVAGAAAAGIKVWEKKTEPEPKDVRRFADSLKFTHDGWATHIEVDRKLVPRHGNLFFTIRDAKRNDRTQIYASDYPERLTESYRGFSYGFSRIHPTDKTKTIVTLVSQTHHPKVIEAGLDRFLFGTWKVLQQQAIPRFNTVTHKGITVYTEAEAPHDEGKIREIAEELAIVQPVIARGKYAREIYLNRARTEGGEHQLRFNFSHEPEGNTGIILGKTDAIKMGLHRQITFHEAAHAVYWSKLDSREAKSFNSFANMKLRFIFNGLQEQRRMLMDKKTREVERAREEAQPITAVFDESSYIRSDNRLGHPYSNSAELFASSSNIMRHYPQAFIEKLENLKNARTFKRYFKEFGPQEAAELQKREAQLSYPIGIEAALRVVKIYGNYAPHIFSSELLSYLQRKKRELRIKD